MVSKSCSGSVKKQNGGGTFAMYCDLCYLPFSMPYTKKSKDALRQVDLTWIVNGLGFDTKTKTIIPVSTDSGYGSFPIKGRDGEFVDDAHNSLKDQDYDAFGFAFHEKCIACISEQLMRPITYKDGEDIRELMMRRRGDYHSQDYQWDEAIAEEGTDYFISPATKKGEKVRARILKQNVLDWIDSHKVSKKTKDKPIKYVSKKQPKETAKLPKVDKSPEVKQPKVDKSPDVKLPKKSVKQAKKSVKPTKQPNQSTKVKKVKFLPCPSHKTKEDCNRNDCLWGKTNKCSKKRVSRKTSA